MEDNAAGPEPKLGSSAPDPELQARLLKLEQEAAALRHQLQGAQTAEPQQAPEAASAPPEDELPPPTSAQLQEAENLIRQARLARTRGQSARAGEMLKMAEKMCPNSPLVLEFIGDDQLERRQFKEARATFARALKLDPKNAAIETKYAQTVLRTQAYFDPNMYSDYEQVANAKMAAVLSFFIPGLGQIVIGEYVKGILILAFWIGCLVAMRLIPGGFQSLMDIMSLKFGFQTFNALVLVPLGGALILMIGAAIDLAFRGGSTKPPKIERPTPPENLPFE